MRPLRGLVLVAGLLIAGGAVAYKQGWLERGLSAIGGRASAASTVAVATPLFPVEVATARSVRTTTDIHSIGSLQSDEAVQVASEVAGRIAEIRFKEGEKVKAGDVLVKLDDALIRASQNEMEARLELARANYERAERLQKTGSGTARSLDEAIAERNTATALLNLQQVQLSKHTITAPFDGVVGLRSVSTGAYIGIGTALVNLEKIDTLKVDFRVPEAQLANIAVGQEVEVSVDALPGRKFLGTIYAIDPLIDVNGRALKVRARLSNADMTLRPGLFARVTVKGREPRTAVFVPEAAVVPRGQERVVWRVVQGKAVESKVRLGERRAGEVEIAEGLEAGATVVTAGHGRLRANAGVEIVGTPSTPQS
ncbi:efflux RND transporter periplasmic adaptor subunit [Bosea sp. 117]|uniref:efflux RND transporter periplasmic adaptor subunit n=1 Tax=Bosea sp. 117 TaxID=1125973 RepID=UPI0004944A2C|nr:efflux RND transporter periplasmic adaptor subunit [Bosea sp. 117]